MKTILPAIFIVLLLINVLGYDVMHFLWHFNHDQDFTQKSFSKKSSITEFFTGIIPNVIPDLYEVVDPDPIIKLPADDQLISMSLSFGLDQYPVHTFAIDPDLLTGNITLLKESSFRLFPAGFCTSIFQPPRTSRIS